MPDHDDTPTLHIVCTATAPDGRRTHHLIPAVSGAMAYRKLKPLLSPGSTIETASVPEYMRRHGNLPATLYDPDGKETPSHELVPEDIIALGRLAASNPNHFWNEDDDGRPL